jgi:hypothetical protein
MSIQGLTHGEFSKIDVNQPPTDSLQDRLTNAIKDWQSKIIDKAKNMPDIQTTAEIVEQFLNVYGELNENNKSSINSENVKDAEKLNQTIHRALENKKFNKVYLSNPSGSLSDLEKRKIELNTQAKSLLEKQRLSSKDIEAIKILLEKYKTHQKACKTLNIDFNFDHDIINDLEKLSNLKKTSESNNQLALPYQSQELLSQELLLNRTHWVGHSRNQYNPSSSQRQGDTSFSRSACSGISIVTVHQLLANPNEFVSNSEKTFEDLLEKGAEVYLRSITLYNEMLNLSQTHEFLYETLIEEGFKAMCEAIQLANGSYKYKNLNEFYQQNRIPSNENKDLFNQLMKFVEFKKNEGDFLSLNDDSVKNILKETLTEITSGSFQVNSQTEFQDYKNFLLTLQDSVHQNNSAIGTIIHIGPTIFSMAMYPNGEILIADSHGINFIRHPENGGAPFAVMMPANIDDAAYLMAMHKPANQGIVELTNTPNLYYFYKLKSNEEPTPLNRELFVTAHQSVFAPMNKSSPQLKTNSVINEKTNATNPKKDELINYYYQLKTTPNEKIQELPANILQILINNNLDIDTTLTNLAKEIGSETTEEAIMISGYQLTVSQQERDVISLHLKLLKKLLESFQSLEKNKKDENKINSEIEFSVGAMNPELKRYYLYCQSKKIKIEEIIKLTKNHKILSK